MNRIVKILMKRDDMTRDEAEELVQEVREGVKEAIETGYYYEAEDIMLSELGLEIDYIFDLL